MCFNFNNTYTALPQMYYRHQAPVAAPAPEMVIFNENLAVDLGLNTDKLSSRADIFSGAALPYGAEPISQAYAGFQFGHFSMLGDGRAVLLGEHITPDGRRVDIQLKGSGSTPFSRGGDGLAALGPMLREYIISEAMFALGIPTTRSLAVAKTGGTVWRQKALQGSVLTRVAASHIRVGTFNYAMAYGDTGALQKLADYAIWRHFSHLEGCKDKYLMFFREVAAKQASLIAKWQLIGFVHGVMNTDNMAICGETIDYGPCAFMDVYEPDTVFSSIDTNGRYAYKNQPSIGAWNLSRLAEALLPLIDENRQTAIELATAEIEAYYAAYDKHWMDGMQAKLGLYGGECDEDIVAQLLVQMQQYGLDYTNTFRSLSCGDDVPQLAEWQSRWRKTIQNHPSGAENALKTMQQHNPAVIPRNHRVEEALAAAEEGDFDVATRLLAAVTNPFSNNEEYAAPPSNSCEYRTFCGT